MKKIISLLIATLLFFGTAQAQISWNTFLGGSSYDVGYEIDMDADGNIYIVGASNNPWGSPIRAHQGGVSDAFVAKLSGNGTLIWLTFLGGPGEDMGHSIVVDQADASVYITGQSREPWGSSTWVEPYHGQWDGFVAKINSNGVLQWNSFVGGQFTNESAYGITLSGSTLYLTGGSDYQCFIGKMNTNGNLLGFDVFGSNDLIGFEVKLSPGGILYVFGRATTSLNTSSWWGSPLENYNGGNDAFLAAFDVNTVFGGGANHGMLWYTFLGCSGNDWGYGLCIDENDNAYVSGLSGCTWGSPVSIFTGGEDAFLAKYNSSGARQWNTFLGSFPGVFEWSTCVNLGSDDTVYMSGSLLNGPFVAQYSRNNGIRLCLYSYAPNTGGGARDLVYQNGVVYTVGESYASWGSPIDPHEDYADISVFKDEDGVCCDDPDGDGVCADVENCQFVANADQADADNDGIGDACDACPNDQSNDADGDGVCVEVDNCQFVANADQTDADNDGIGDACDACPNEPNAALSFDGGNWVEIPDHPSLSPCPTCSFTVEMWVLRESDNWLQHILAKRAGCDGGSNFYQMVFDPYLNFGNTDLGSAYTDIDLPLYEWHHLAAVYDGTQFLFYYDGTLAATGQGTLGDGAGNTLKLGGSGDCYGQFFGGKMDNVRIWNVARTQEEIQAGMFGCIVGTEEGLAGAWDFNEGSGTVAHDLSPNNNDGMLINNPAWVTSTLPCCSGGTSLEVNAGTCQVVYYGYDPEECTSLTAAVSNGTPPYSFLWSNGATTASISVCPTATTIYSVTVTDDTGVTGTDNVIVEVVDVHCGNNNNKVFVCHNPNGNSNTLCIAQNTVLAHLNHGDYLGPCGTSPCSGGQNLIVPVGTDNVMDADIFRMTIFEDPADTEETFNQHGFEAKPGELILYPNPTTDNIQLAYDGVINEIRLISAQGLEIRSFETDADLREINLEQVPSGLYVLMLRSGDKWITKKFIKL